MITWLNARPGGLWVVKTRWPDERGWLVTSVSSTKREAGRDANHWRRAGMLARLAKYTECGK